MNCLCQHGGLLDIFCVECSVQITVLTSRLQCRLLQWQAVRYSMQCNALHLLLLSKYENATTISNVAAAAAVEVVAVHHGDLACNSKARKAVVALLDQFIFFTLCITLCIFYNTLHYITLLLIILYYIIATNPPIRPTLVGKMSCYVMVRRSYMFIIPYYDVK